MKILAPVGALVLVALLSTEVSMNPNGKERITFSLLFGGAAAVTVVLARILPTLRSGS